MHLRVVRARDTPGGQDIILVGMGRAVGDEDVVHRVAGHEGLSGILLEGHGVVLEEVGVAHVESEERRHGGEGHDGPAARDASDPLLEEGLLGNASSLTGSNTRDRGRHDGG